MILLFPRRYLSKVLLVTPRPLISNRSISQNLFLRLTAAPPYIRQLVSSRLTEIRLMRCNFRALGDVLACKPNLTAFVLALRLVRAPRLERGRAAGTSFRLTEPELQTQFVDFHLLIIACVLARVRPLSFAHPCTSILQCCLDPDSDVATHER